MRKFRIKFDMWTFARLNSKEVADNILMWDKHSRWFMYLWSAILSAILSLLWVLLLFALEQWVSSNNIAQNGMDFFGVDVSYFMLWSFFFLGYLFLIFSEMVGQISRTYPAIFELNKVEKELGIDSNILILLDTPRDKRRVLGLKYPALHSIIEGLSNEDLCGYTSELKRTKVRRNVTFVEVLQGLLIWRAIPVACMQILFYLGIRKDIVLYAMLWGIIFLVAVGVVLLINLMVIKLSQFITLSQKDVNFIHLYQDNLLFHFENIADSRRMWKEISAIGCNARRRGGGGRGWRKR